MPLLDTTPNTVGYLIAGYIFLLGLPIAYIVTWFIRRRSLERDMDMLESLRADEHNPTDILTSDFSLLPPSHPYRFAGPGSGIGSLYSVTVAQPSPIFTAFPDIELCFGTP